MRIHAWKIAFLTLGLSALLFMSIACGSSGPVIEVDDVNVRNLCNFSVSGEDEERCNLDPLGTCTMGDQFCWDAEDPEYLSQGFCRECAADNNCAAGESCDHGWCHADCSAHGDCAAGEKCVGGSCRTPHFTDFSFSNSGSGDLEVYVSQTTLEGDAGACVFTDLVWSKPGDPIIVGPEDSVLLRVYFLPPDVGEFHGIINIMSNDSAMPSLPLFMCGQALESVCTRSVDAQCYDCAECVESVFEPLMGQDPGCSLNHDSSE